MSTERAKYRIKPISINGRLINEVVIDPHYKVKHAGYMSDELVIALIKKLDGRWEIPRLTRGVFEYYVTLIELEEKQYRIVWLLEHGSVYVGVINAFRDRRRK